MAKSFISRIQKLQQRATALIERQITKHQREIDRLRSLFGMAPAGPAKGRKGRAKPAKARRKTRRTRRTTDQIAAEAGEIVSFIKSAGAEGRSGREIKAHTDALHPGMTIKAFVRKYAGVKLRTKGKQQGMRYFA